MIDRVVIEHAIRCAFLAGTQDEGLLYLDKRLRSRRTNIEWEKEVLGPIRDTPGVEQGGCASDKIYRLVNNEQLQIAQCGVDLGLVLTDSGLVRQVLSASGLADNVCLLASSLSRLKILLHLTELYCDKFQVKLVWSKTNLLVFTTKDTQLQAKVEIAVTPISVDGHQIAPSHQATHVGVVRCPDGNGPNITARMVAHRRAVYSLLHAGLAKSHRANPAASLRIEVVFTMPVLLSGLASLVLSTKEEKQLDQHYKIHI